MQKLKPEERNKAIVLVLACMVFMGYGAKTLLGMRKSTPPAQPAGATQTASAAPIPGSQSATPQQSDAVAALYMEQSAPAPMTRDPFKPPVPIYTPGPASKKLTPGSAPGLPGPPVGGRGVSPVRVLPPALPAVALKGVIDGDPPIAVFESNGQTIYVKKGEPLAAGTQVAHISEAGVVLRWQGKDVSLMVGHAIQQQTPTVAEGLHTRPILPAPAPPHPENATITSAPAPPAPSGTGITELPAMDVQMPGHVPFQIASLQIPAPPTSSVEPPVQPEPAKRSVSPRQVSSLASRHKVKRHKHRRVRKHHRGGRHQRQRHRAASHKTPHASPAHQAPAPHL